MKRIVSLAASVALLSAALAACSNDPTLNNNADTTGANLTFLQIDRLGKPGIKELYLPYAQHATYDQAIPQTDGTAYGPSVASFVTGTAGRSAAIGGYVAALLLPDALVANLANGATTASYLGWETGGRFTTSCTGTAPTAFGGRSPLDDVVDVDLGLAFGNLATTSYTAGSVGTPGLTGVTPVADDGREQNGTGGRPLLSSDGVGCGTKTIMTTQFPYLQPPV